MSDTKHYYTRQELIKKTEENQNNRRRGSIDFFDTIYKVTEGYYDIEDGDEIDFDFENQKVEIVYDQNFGDGNEWHVALFFPKENISIFMEGYYSSHGESELTRASIGIKYEFKEMRYKAASKDELRDISIETIIE